MITLTQLTELLGWAALLNICFLMFATIVLVVFKSTVIKIHNKLFEVSEERLSQAYFRYLANYKTLTLIFNITPYIALKIMGH